MRWPRQEGEAVSLSETTGLARLGEGGWRRRRPLIVAIAAGLLGFAFFLDYYRHGLTLVHYDAKARLLVARRVFDNIEPGIDQMGLYWLPLPSLLNIPLVTNDRLYETGIASSLLSVCLFATATYFLYRLAYLLRGDHALALAAAAIFATNPSMLFLQSTPLTEALYFAVSLGAVFFLTRFMFTEDRRDLLSSGAFVALATLVRYDGWSLWAGANILFVVFLLQNREPLRTKRTYLLTFAITTTLGIVAYQLYCYYTTGILFPPQQDSRPLIPYSQGRALESVLIFVQCAGDIAGRPVFWAAVIGAIVFLAYRLMRPPFLAAYALLHAVPLFALAYFNGHPYRVRYSVALLPAISLFAVICWPARRWAKVALAVLVIGNMLRPAEQRQLMLREAAFHLPEIQEREQAIAYLKANYDGSPVLASMGWVAPFLHDWGIPLQRTIHEGVQTAWQTGLERPRYVAGWVLMEDGDPLYQAMLANPRFLDDFSEALRLSNFSIYRRVDANPPLGLAGSP